MIESKFILLKDFVDHINDFDYLYKNVPNIDKIDDYEYYSNQKNIWSMCTRIYMYNNVGCCTIEVRYHLKRKEKNDPLFCKICDDFYKQK